MKIKTIRVKYLAPKVKVVLVRGFRPVCGSPLTASNPFTETDPEEIW